MAERAETRPPVMADLFYPGQPRLLNQQLDTLFETDESLPFEGEVHALIVPHAGYQYSGQVAAAGYRVLRERDYGVVVLIGPSHREEFSGVSVFAGDSFATPLGNVPVATLLAKKVAEASDDIFVSWQGHGEEHALEVQLPFLQRRLRNFSVIPITMGEQDETTCKGLADALTYALADESVLIVASSDLSHYYSYEDAVKLDSVAVEVLEEFSEQAFASAIAEGSCQACGAGAIMTALMASRKFGADHVRVLDYKNSGDVTGERDAVVGYLSAVAYRRN